MRNNTAHSMLSMHNTINKEQEKLAPDPIREERAEMECIQFLLKSDNPKLVQQGRQRLINAIVRRLKTEELIELSAYLLANRRDWFVGKIKEKNKEINNETATALS